MKLADALEQRILILDGAMGTEILRRTGKSFECPDILNISSESAVILDIHRAYIDAGADIIETKFIPYHIAQVTNKIIEAGFPESHAERLW